MLVEVKNSLSASYRLFRAPFLVISAQISPLAPLILVAPVLLLPKPRGPLVRP